MRMMPDSDMQLGLGNRLTTDMQQDKMHDLRSQGIIRSCWQVSIAKTKNDSLQQQKVLCFGMVHSAWNNEGTQENVQ